MKKLFLQALLVALVIAGAAPMTAKAEVNISIALPPPIIFAAPPALIVLPETYIYVVPDVEMDIFFYDGWWWRPWEGRWYRSRYYNSGWGYYRNVPSFYIGIPSSWRDDYREQRWRGHPWNAQRIPHKQVQQNWKGWKNNRHWEKQQSWGVQGLQPRTQVKQPSREVQERQSKQQTKEVKQERVQQQREASPQSRETVKTQQREVSPHSREAVKPQQSQQRQEKQERGKKGKKDRN